ncbi:MAG: HEAT repeat domain-containing protein [Candidatus Eisenbacteria bacterium]|nr:HEAT repeat domain-containing protein [Candidatus Eisenbacteria bacterium]
MSAFLAPAAAFAAALVLVASLGTVALVMRAAHRGERDRARRELADLAGHLAALLEGRAAPADVAAAAAAADPVVFWTALEGLAPTRRQWCTLSRALARCPQPRAERAALRDDSPWRRELAARRLALLDGRATRRALRAALRRGPELVALAAATALARARDAAALCWVLEHSGALAHRTPRARVELLRAWGRAALPVLAERFEREAGDTAMDRALAEALGLGRHRPARATLERRLADRDAEVRAACARALGRIADAGALPALARALSDEAWPVRAMSAWALGRIGESAALPALAPRLTDPAWWVRRHAAWALAALGEQGRAELTRIAGGSPDPYARDMARAALEHRAGAA